MATIFENVKKFASISVAYGLVTTSNACFVAGEKTGIAARKVAGEHWDKVPGSARNDRLLQAVIAGKSPEPVPAPEASPVSSQQVPAPAKAKGVSHSPMVIWDQWHWIPSQLAEEEARKQGYEKALLLYLYKASNALICLAKYGKGDLGEVYKGNSYAEWVCLAIAKHAEWLRDEKGVKNAFSRLGQYYDQAAKRVFVPCPSWEEVKAAAAAAANLKHSQEPEIAPQPVPQPAPVPQTPPVVEENLSEVMAEELAMLNELPDAAPVREGRTPATPAEPEEVVRKYDELRKVIGVTAVRANNAKGAAEKAKAAFEAGKINASEMRLFLEKAASKLPEGSDEAAAILAIA